MPTESSDLVPLDASRRPLALPQTDEEARRVLEADARRAFGAIPERLVADQILAATPGAPWPVREAALEALERRWAFARQGGLVAVPLAAGAPLLGRHATRTRGGRQHQARPYHTVVTSLEPLRGSCDCPDFLKGSLGLCKHLLVVLDHLFRTASLRTRALREQAAPRAPRLALTWDPVRPLTGSGDWLARLMFHPGVDRGCDRRLGGGDFDVDGHPDEAIRQSPEGRRLLVKRLERLAVEHPERVEPAVTALLADERRRLDRAAAGEKDVARLPATLRTLRQKLFPYQVEGVRALLATGRLLLADDMGLGKTAQGIAAAHVLLGLGRVDRVLVVTPASLKPQWLREWTQFTDVPAAIVDGAPAERAALYGRTRKGALLTNYEQVLRDLPVIQDWAPGLVILDEAQRIKNWATKTALVVKQLAAPFRLVLTGTPMENRLDELASLMDWIDDDALAPKWRLAPLHMITEDGGRQAAGVRNLGTIRERLRGSLVRRLRSEVLDQLPARTDVRVPVELTPEQSAEHQDLEQPIRSLVARASKRPLRQEEFLRLMMLLTRQRVICNGMAQLEFEDRWPDLVRSGPTEARLKSLGSPKLLELRELVRALVAEQGRKVVIFSQWRRMLQLAAWATADLLAGAGKRSAFFSGDEGLKRRTENVVDFHDDPTLAVLFATDAGGVGLNLQRAASSVINLETPWNPAVLEQRIGRIHRLGQKHPIEVYHLVTEGGIEARIMDLVSDKRALFTGLFDGTSDEVLFESSGSFLSRVQQLVETAPAEAAEEDVEAAEETAMAVEDGDALMEPATPDLLDTPAPAEPAAPPAVVYAALPALDVAALLPRIAVRALPGGGIALEAPPEAAAALAGLLMGLAQQITAATQAAPPPGPVARS